MSDGVNNPRLVGILQVIGMIGSALSEAEFNALVDALFAELNVERPKETNLTVVKGGG